MGNSDSRRKLWAQREAKGKCIYCGKYAPRKSKKGCKACLKKKTESTISFSKNNKERIAQYRLRIKHEVISKYGNVCSCCKESQILFLTIDHKNNDGAKDRKEEYGVKNPATISWYLKLRREPLREDLQVLCFNCNLGKALNGGQCPHRVINKVLGPSYDNRRNSNLDKGLKIDWPSDDELISMCNEISVAQAAKKLGVDFSAISGRLKRRNKYHLVIKRTGKGAKSNEPNEEASA